MHRYFQRRHLPGARAFTRREATSQRCDDAQKVKELEAVVSDLIDQNVRLEKIVASMTRVEAGHPVDVIYVPTSPGTPGGRRTFGRAEFRAQGLPELK